MPKIITSFSQSYREDVEWPALQAFALQAFSSHITDWSRTEENRFPVVGGKEIEPFVYEDGEYHVQVFDPSGKFLEEWRIFSYDPDENAVHTKKYPADKPQRQ